MKRSAKKNKLAIHHQTLRLLNSAEIERASGGGDLKMAESGAVCVQAQLISG